MKTLKHFSIKTFLTTLAFAILGMAAVNAHAATVDYFLKIDGIDGESATKGHEKWIDINSFSWGVSNSGAGGGGAGTGKAAFSPFSWTQQLDKSVLPMFTGVASGKHFKNATLDAVKAGGEKSSAVFFKMEFDDVLLTQLNIAGTGDVPGVDGAFDSYTKLTMTYKQQLANGTYGPAIIGGWDIRGGRAAPAFFGSPLALEGLFLAQSASPVPVPGAVWLFGSGLLGLMGVARRKARTA